MKFLRINMTELTAVYEEIPEPYKGLGGRGLTSEMINRQVPPTCDALGPRNKLIIAVGLLAGTSFINISRISVGAKSPLTGGIKESNAGGNIGAYMGQLGIRAIIVEGRAPADQLYLLKIESDGTAQLVEASDCRLMRTYALVDKLRQDHGEKYAIACIGPAGEHRMASASIQTSDADGRPCRAAGRGGMGAVMGSKGLKAILVNQGGTFKAPIADPEAFKEGLKKFTRTVKENPSSGMMMPALGTAGLVAPVNSFGAFPSFNATAGVLPDWEKISGETMAETIKARGGKTTHMGCARCIVHCSNEFVQEDGSFVTGSLEYETIWAMGGMTGITDLDTIARLDRLADDIGVDTMNTGVAIAVAMDAGYRKFEDGQEAIELMEEIAADSQIGRVIGNGPAAVGAHFKHHRVPVVKKQSIAAYDPRRMPANGVTYATSPMGADHTSGNLVGEYLTGELDPEKPDGHIEASRNIQPVMAFVDCAGICLFATFSMATAEGGEAFFKALSALLGKPFGPPDMISMGERCLRAERDFNRRAGLTGDDDRLPEFFRKEPLPPSNAVFKIPEKKISGLFAES
jgi:aldehyde:ferredoxin oxidoreductase